MDSVRRAVRSGDMVVIDEVGPMEILSRSFRDAVTEALDSGATVLGTIVKKSKPFTDAVKARPDVTVFDVNKENRDSLVGDILRLLKEEG